MIASFAVSAVFHEYVFDIAAVRFQGYKTAFFLVQGLAVAATVRVRPRGWHVALWVIGTLAFNLVTSTLFFASMNGACRFTHRDGRDSLLLRAQDALSNGTIAALGLRLWQSDSVREVDRVPPDSGGASECRALAADCDLAARA